MSNQLCVIVGAGHAAAQMIASLIQEGWPGRICLVGDEPYLPYNRPPLSKSLLAGEATADDLLIRPADSYRKVGVQCLLNTRVEKIDIDNKQVLLTDGELLTYHKLVLCTGARPRRLSLPGSELSGIHYLRTIDDVYAIRAASNIHTRVVLIGGGYIGLETAAMMRKIGMKVTVLEAGDRLLNRVTAPQMSTFFQQLHEKRGAKIITGAQVTALTGDGRVEHVHCQDDQVYPADLVVVGIGVTPDTFLAGLAGLDVDDGIVVDAHCVTSQPDILAAGDCTHFMNDHYQRSMRVESVQNAVDQAKVAAATLCGKNKVYDQLPWFWSDQYDIKLQIAGLSQGYTDVVVRGSITPNAENKYRFAIFYLKDDRLLAVDAVNSPQDFMFGKRLIQAGGVIDKINLQDQQVHLKSLL